MSKTNEEDMIVPNNQQLASANDVLGAINLIDSKLNELEEITGSEWKAGEDFYFDENDQSPNKVYKLRVIKDVNTLDKIGALLYANKVNYDNYMSEIMKLDDYPEFTHQGYSFGSWIDDIKKRRIIILQKERKDMLENAKKELSVFLSEQEKKKQIVSKYAKLLGF